MIAYKFLAAGGVAPFTGVAWPLPRVGGGAWVHGDLDSNRAVHACVPSQLPWWLGEELWRVELAGNVVHGEHQISAASGRLLERIDRWPEARPGFSDACIERTRERVVAELRKGGLTADAERLAAQRDPVALIAEARSIGKRAAIAGYLSDAVRARSNPAACGYIAANAAALAGGEEGHHAERRAQGQWLLEACLL